MAAQEPVNLLLVGCGMMGARHVRGLGELQRVRPDSFRLAAVCDRRVDLAENVAAEAEDLLGVRPAIYDDFEKVLEEASGGGHPYLQAADVVTDPRSHDEIVVGLLSAGLDVLCEKPLAVTVVRGITMLHTAQKQGRVLGIAENNRRDPMNRLAKACLDASLIGEPNFVLQVVLNPADRIIATAWRHRLAMGGVLLDVAIHAGYILEYLLGPVKAVTAQAQLVQAARRGAEFDGTQVAVEVDSEDCFSALLEFESGAQGHFTAHFASPGETMNKRLIVGSQGTLALPPDRSGAAVEIQKQNKRVSGQELLDLVPQYELNEIETALFGERPASYALDWPVVDRKLIAAEMHDFVQAIGTRQAPETSGEAGLRSVGIIHAIMESALAGRRVTLDEVLSCELREYQERIEEAEV